MPGSSAAVTAPPAPLSPASARSPIQQPLPAVSLTGEILSRLLESQKHADVAWSSDEIELLRTLILKTGTGDWEAKAAQLNHKIHGNFKIRSAKSLESMAASLQAMQKSGPMLPAGQSLQTAADAEKKKAESSQEETCTLCGSSESGDEKHLLPCGGCSTLQHNTCLVSHFPPSPFPLLFQVKSLFAQTPPLALADIPMGDWYCGVCEAHGVRSLQLNQAQAMSVASKFYDNTMGEVSAALSAGFSWVSKEPAVQDQRVARPTSQPSDPPDPRFDRPSLSRLRRQALPRALDSDDLLMKPQQAYRNKRAFPPQKDSRAS